MKDINIVYDFIEYILSFVIVLDEFGFVVVRNGVLVFLELVRYEIDLNLSVFVLDEDVRGEVEVWVYFGDE